MSSILKSHTEIDRLSKKSAGEAGGDRADGV